MRSARIVFTDMDLDGLSWWDKEFEHEEGFGNIPLNGKVYHGYNLLSAGGGEDVAVSGKTQGRQMWGGRVPFVAAPTQVASIDTLRKDSPETGIGGFNEMMRVMKERIALRRQQGSVGSWVAVSIHEKIHGIQNHNLPLPLLEIVAYYYEREFMNGQGWKPRENEGFQRALDYWRGLVDKYGANIHQFVFGNLQGEEGDKMKTALLAEFSPAIMEELFPQPIDQQRVVWDTSVYNNE